MSHIGTAMINSHTSRNNTRISRNISKINKNPGKNQNFTNQSYMKNDDEIYSCKSKVLRTPKPLTTEEYLLISQYKYSLIDDELKKKKKLCERPIVNYNQYKDTGDYSLNKESSLEKSTESNKVNTESHVEKKSGELSKSDTESDDHKRNKKKIVKKEINFRILDENVNIRMEETSTNLLFYIPSFTISNEDKNNYNKFEDIKNNYTTLIKKKVGSDNFNNRNSQTREFQKKHAACLTNFKNITTKGIQTFEFEIEKELREDQLEIYEKLNEKLKNESSKEVNEILNSPFTLLPVDLNNIKATQLGLQENYSYRENLKKKEREEKDSRPTNNNTNNYGTRKFTNSIFDKHNNIKEFSIDLKKKFIDEQKIEFKNSIKKENEYLILTKNERNISNCNEFKNGMKYIEKILNQNILHKEYISYKNYPEILLKSKNIENKYMNNFIIDNKVKKEKEVKNNKILDYLFDFYNKDLCKDYSVTTGDWNNFNNDLFAAGYGDFDISRDKEGMILLWTYKNPFHPEKIIKTNSKILSLKFSQKNPYLLGTGMYNGIVAIYDLRDKGSKPVVDSTDLDLKHLDSVWEVDWVSKGNNSDKGESLVSISSDGRINEWTIKKGLESQELKVITKVNNSYNKNVNIKTINFRYNGGFSFNFLPGDSIIYFISTENGTIHRCSKSYKENYSKTYLSHNGPVYKVRCNPFNPDYFITCCSDWYIRLWNSKEEELPKLVLKNLDLNDELTDIEWSPFCSTVFASTARDGRLEFWDLSKKSLDPICIDWNKSEEKDKSIKYPSRNIVRFHKSNQLLLTGDDDGACSIYRIHGYENFLDNNQNQNENLSKIWDSNYDNLKT